MKINIHAGHNPAGKTACGAVGILDESKENRKVKNYLISCLRKQGHTVYDCTCDNGVSQNDVLYKIVSKCNEHSVDVDISLHLNCGGGHGAECEIYGTGGMAQRYAEKIQSAICRRTGYTDRGVKIRRDLYVLRKTNAPAVLVECCFVDSSSDARVWNPAKMAAAICEGITGIYPQSTSVSSSFEIYVAEDCFVRSKASRDSDKKYKAEKGTEYTVINETGNWYKLKSGGWIAKKHTKRKYKK